MMKTLVISSIAVVAMVLGYAATRPDTFRVARSATVNAPPQVVHALINDLRQFNTWNPYEKKDPMMQGTYRGPAAGPGAAYDFRGDSDVGKGSIEIVSSAPAQNVTMKLDMLEPFEGHNIVEFTLAPRGTATEVTWAMHGPSPFMARLIGLFLDMDRMIGRDFEAGLSNLKARVERS